MTVEHKAASELHKTEMAAAASNTKRLRDECDKLKAATESHKNGCDKVKRDTATMKEETDKKIEEYTMVCLRFP
jgi:multidrug resistance efflux pump